MSENNLETGKPLSILDEGVTVDNNVESLDFVGAGVEATGNSDVEVSVEGGGGDSLPDQTGNDGKFLTTDGSSASWGTPAGSGAFYDQPVTPTNGQTSFTLDHLPVNNSSVFMIINGQTFTPGKGFIISGTTITWDESFAIADTDSIVLRFKK